MKDNPVQDLVTAIVKERHRFELDFGAQPQYLLIHPDDYKDIVALLKDAAYTPVESQHPTAVVFGMKALRSPDIERGTTRVTR